MIPLFSIFRKYCLCLEPGDHVLTGVPAAEVDLVPAQVELLDPEHAEHLPPDPLQRVVHAGPGGVELAAGRLNTPVLPRFLPISDVRIRSLNDAFSSLGSQESRII